MNERMIGLYRPQLHQRRMDRIGAAVSVAIIFAVVVMVLYTL